MSSKQIRFPCVAVIAVALLSSLASIPAYSQHGFTGEILTLIYATDVRESVAFYEALGFEHQYYYDYENDAYKLDWDLPNPPEYAEVSVGKIRIGITTPDDNEGVFGGGVRHYFMVDDVESHYRKATTQGLVPEPNEVEIRPWLHFFTIADPDNHQIVIAQKNEEYYAEIANQLRKMRQQR